MTGRRLERTRPAGTQLPARPRLEAHVEPIHIGSVEPRPAETPSRLPESGSPGEQPRYLRMARLDARLRPDQVAALGELRRRIAAGRVDRSERITDNTLLRVAVDLLLAHADRLAGDTEDALRASVTDSGSPGLR